MKYINHVCRKNPWKVLKRVWSSEQSERGFSRASCRSTMLGNHITKLVIIDNWVRILFFRNVVSNPRWNLVKLYRKNHDFFSYMFCMLFDYRWSCTIWLMKKAWLRGKTRRSDIDSRNRLIFNNVTQYWLRRRIWVDNGYQHYINCGYYNISVTGHVTDRHRDFLLWNDRHSLCNSNFLLRIRYFISWNFVCNFTILWSSTTLIFIKVGQLLNYFYYKQLLKCFYSIKNY
jgi:hypothetical protein